jgi:dipeptidyl aminopeptidase/acylaminoacyl peptidase
MKKNVLLIGFVLLLNTACQNTHSDNAPKQYTMRQFMDVKGIIDGGFSADESKLLLGSDESGIFNLFELDLKTLEKKQLTQSTKESIYPVSYFPSSNEIILSMDKGGNEIYHLYVLDNNGRSTDLISDTAAKANFFGWSRDKKAMYFSSNTRDKRFFDLYKAELIPTKNRDDSNKLFIPPTLLYENNEGLEATAVSANERFIALTKEITTNNGEMYLFDTQTRQVKLISKHKGDARYTPQYFSIDGKTLYFLSNENSEFTYLAAYDITSGKITKIEDASWDILFAKESRNGKYRIVGINNDAKIQVKIIDQSGGNIPLEFKGLPPGNISNVTVSDSEKWMIFSINSSQSPKNLYLYHTESKTIKQLTNTLSSEINPNDLVEGKAVSFPSFDGLSIPGLLFLPKGIKEGQKVPALVQVHGGPGGQTMLNYVDEYQYLLNHGYAILCVNNRGSSGYGKSFYAADDLKHGNEDLKDCIAGKKYLQTLATIDTSKIGILGGSYGGYMVMAALTFAPEEFAVGVNYFGVTNWLRTLKSIPPWWASFRDALYKELGDPVKDSVALYNKSPLFHANKIKRPFIVLQGSNDPRVLQVESDEMVAAARKNGVPVEYVVFPDEGHGFVKKENIIKGTEEVLKFLDKHLKGNK